MEVEGVSVKTEDDCMAPSRTQSTVKKEAESDCEAAQVKLESELILSDDDDEAYSQEILSGNSSLNPAVENNRMMVHGKTVKIILQRCDAGDAPKFSAEQSSTSRIKNEDCSDVPVVSVKLENDLESTETGETCVTDANDVMKAAVSGSKQCDYHPEANSSVEIKAEGLITHELVCHLPGSQGSAGIVKNEESKLQLDFDHHFSVRYANEETVNNYKEGTWSLNEGNTVKTAKDESLGACSESNAGVKTEEEEGEKVRITNVLVSSLKGELKCVEKDEKPLLKILKCEESKAQAESEMASNFEHPAISEAANAEIDKTVPVVFKPKNKVSPKVKAKGKASVERYSCSECSHRCNNKTDMANHMRVHTGERPYECKECHQKFKTKGQLNVHMITHTNKRLFECVHCAATFKRKGCLIRHLRRHSDERPFSCTECLAKFKSRRELTTHSVTHSSERRFECAHCDLRLKSKAILRTHMRSHFDIKSHSCTLCGAKFRQNSGLKSHLRTKHSSERPFQCTQCGVRFKSKSDLKKHSLIHSGKKPCQCPYCPSTFRRNGHVKNHLVAKHTSEKSYACAHCSLMFKLRREVASHLRTHSNEKPHSCPQCPKTFKFKSSQRVHLRSHTGEKPYSCSQCPAKFSKKCNLKAHLTVHSDERPFACDQCPAKFKRCYDLKKHKKTHVAVTLLSCVGAD